MAKWIDEQEFQIRVSWLLRWRASQYIALGVLFGFVMGYWWAR